MLRRRITFWLLCAVLLTCGRTSFAAPSVTAVLSNSDAMVGEMVQLEIRLTDAGKADVPNEIRVDGLEIHRTGTSQQFEMRNFTTTSSITYNYTVLPLKPGTFKIPTLTIQVAGTSLRTPELTLRVSGSAGGQNAPNTAGSPGAGTGKIAFAELIVPKKTAYVGEMIPVVVNLCFATRGNPTDIPDFPVQGFTMQRLQPPDQAQEATINGRPWQVFSYKTAISPTRPGKFELGPVRCTAVVALPRRHGTSRSRSPLDPFNLDDPFNDPFFRDPFGSMSQRERITVTGDPVTLEVKPLPANAPPTFNGAVGNFTMAAEAKPKNVQVGDPITVTATISGRGNFDRMNAPALEDDAGWHKYPPSSKFKQDDDVGISGQKTFETVISPNEKKNAVPPLVFCFFDPAKEQYVTLRSDQVPIRVEGGNATAAAPAPSTSAAAPPSVAKAPPAAATPPPRDILYQLTERPTEVQAFTPLYATRGFWLAQLAPLLVLIGFGAWKVRQSRLQNRDALRIAGLQHEMAELTRKLKRSDVSPDDYFPHASRLVQLKTALARNLDPNLVDMETAARTFDLDEQERGQLRRIFEQSDELRYSGAGNGNGHDPLPADQRREILRFIERLRA